MPKVRGLVVAHLILAALVQQLRKQNRGNIFFILDYRKTSQGEIFYCLDFHLLLKLSANCLQHKNFNDEKFRFFIW